jgi:hypothetical protein
MPIAVDGSSASFLDSQVGVEKKMNMNMTQLRRSLLVFVTDSKNHDSDLMPPSSPGSQRWVSESETCFDNSPNPPMSGLRRWGSEVRWKQPTLLSRPGPRPFLPHDEEYYVLVPRPPPLLLQERWASESLEQKYIDQYIDESIDDSSDESSFSMDEESSMMDDSSIDECQQDPPFLSGSRRWASEEKSCGAPAYNSAAPPLLPARRTMIGGVRVVG